MKVDRVQWFYNQNLKKGAHYFDDIFAGKSATYHRYSGRINFTQHGIKKSSSRNGYFSVVWRKR